MIYLEPTALTWRPLLTSYINGELYAPLREFAKEFEALFVWIADACIYHIRHGSKVRNLNPMTFIIQNNLIIFFLILKELIPTGDSSLISSLMSWITMLMAEHCENAEEASKNKHLRHWLIVRKFIEFSIIP